MAFCSFDPIPDWTAKSDLKNTKAVYHVSISLRVNRHTFCYGCYIEPHETFVFVSKKWLDMDKFIVFNQILMCLSLVY